LQHHQVELLLQTPPQLLKKSMALRLNKRRFELRNLKPTLITCVAVVGAGVLIVNTFPHLKTTIRQYLHGGGGADEEESDGESSLEGNDNDDTLSSETVVIESIHRDPNNENRTIDSFQVVH